MLEFEEKHEFPDGKEKSLEFFHNFLFLLFAFLYIFWRSKPARLYTNYNIILRMMQMLSDIGYLISASIMKMLLLKGLSVKISIFENYF